MPSKSNNGNSPLGGQRIDGRKGLDSAIGRLSQDIGKRTPRQSMTAGSQQVHNGVFHKPKRQRRENQTVHLEAFKGFGLKNDGGTWSVRVKAGYIIETNEDQTPALKSWTPEVSGDAIDSETKPYPKLTVADGDTVYLNYTTDSAGKIDATPEVAVFSSPTQVHYSSGVTGDFYVELFSIETAPSGGLKIADEKHFGNYYWSIGQAGESIDLPFHLKVRKDGVLYKWQVTSTISSIMNDTNGAVYDLSSAGFDTENNFSATRYIIIKASVSSLSAGSWTISAETVATNKEIELDASTPPEQDELILRIGKVEIIDSVPYATQYVWSPQIVSKMFLNGQVVLGLSSHPYYD